MKKRYLYLLSTAFCLFLAQKAFTNSSGSPSGHSGSPASNNNTCARSGCHSGGGQSTETISISSNIPSAGFEEDSVYTIDIQANNGGTGTNRMGFMASVESPSGHTGTIQISEPSRTKLAGSYITHTFSGISGSAGVNDWSFEWDAGQSPDQTTIYVAVNFSNNNGTTSGDVIITETLTLTKATGGIGLEENPRLRLAAYPNPAQDRLTVAGPAFEAPYQVLSLAGKEVKTFNDSPREGQHWYFDISDLESGLYLLRDSQGRSLRFTKN